MLSRSAAVIVMALALAACGGRGANSALSATIPSTDPALLSATFIITIPGPSTSSKARTPKYISAATKSVRVNLTAASSGITITSQFNVVVLVSNGTGNAPGSPCTGSGPWTCTVTLQVPPGNDTFAFTTYDDTTASGTGSSHVLSQQIQTLSVTKGTANSFNVVFDANASAISLSGTQPCTSGSIQSVFGSGQGTSAVTINVSFTDLASKTIPVGSPGMPAISIQDADGTFHASSGVIHGTGGDANFSINQSAQSFTLTPTAVPLSNVSVIVKGSPANTTGSSDGLTFPAGTSHTFTFSANVAPPAHNFLAVIEQNTAQTAGQINFFQSSLGGPGGPDSLAAWSTAATLSSTNSINESAPDVDNPEAIVFDGGGNLLIANGGQGGAVTSYAPSGDYGNFACVPSGAIANGAALSTTNQTNLRVPDAVAVSGDGTAAIANNPGSAAKNVQQFTLTTNYVAGASFTNPGTYGVPLGRPLVNLPTLTPGTFAFAIFDGTNSKIVILAPSGTTSTVTNAQDSNINNPFAMAWDAINSQLIVGDNNTPAPGHQSYLSFWTVSNPPTAPVKVNSFRLQPDPDPADDCASAQPCSGLSAQKIAVAPTSGYVAVAGVNGYNSSYGGVEIQLYDSNHNPLSNGVIAYDGANTGTLACSFGDPNNDYVFGESGLIVTDLLWLSSTKLLVLLKQPNKTAVQGIYIYDVTATSPQSGFWGTYSSSDHACHGNAIPNGPSRTYFQNVPSLIPLAATFKP